MSLYQQAPTIITSFIMLIVIGIILFFYYQAKSAKKLEANFLEQLEMASGKTDQEYIESKKQTNKNDIIYKWNRYWGQLLKHSEILNKDLSDKQIGFGIFFISILIYIISFLIFKNLGIGFVPILLGYYSIQVISKNKIKKKEKIFDDQIKPFLSTLKANIQANETPERALINAINQSNDPLYSEIIIAKNLTEAGSFKLAIRELRKRTENESLKFLCSCIELSTQVGANLESQIEVIENMIDVKHSLKRKLELAVQENKPLVVVTSALIPSLFLYTYLTSDITKEYWFVKLSSWFVALAVVLIFSGAIYITNRMIEKVGKF